MRSNKHGRVWRKAIALSFQSSSCMTITGSSLWFVRSDISHNRLKVLVGILSGPPKPAWSKDDTEVARGLMQNPSKVTWDTWSEGPTKLAVLRALGSCNTRLDRIDTFDWDITYALAQQWVCFLHSYSFGVDEVHY